MKRSYLTLFLIFLITNVYSQSKPFSKYKGVWNVENMTFSSESLTMFEITDNGIKCFYDSEGFDVDGNPILVLVECNSDSIVDIKPVNINLKDTVINRPINDYGESEDVKAKTYKGAVFLTETKQADFFTLISHCESELPVMEFVFYSEKEGVLLINRKEYVSKVAISRKN